MWKLGNRTVIVLVCVLSGCVILYNIWGSVLGIIITLLLVIYASVLLLTNDDLQTPHALQLLEYIERADRELYNLLQNISCQTTTYTVYLIEIAKTFYRNYIIRIMDGRRRNTYQLSTDTFINSNRNLDLNMVEGLTPIARNRRRSYISGSENNCGIDSVNSRGYGSAKSLAKVSSTPLLHQWEKRESANGDVNYRDTDIIGGNQTALKRPPSLYLNDHTMSREEETIYSPRGSPWGTSISPKMRPRAAGVKTVQTVAGPLLTSTRYNIDPKIYTDVTSPGLPSRLTKYATEANMKLIHQSQYGAGQFPKVNLNASPTPIINSRSPRGRTSVTVRIAPPDTTGFSSSERRRMLSTVCQTKNETPPSVAQVLKEISLKRHASCDDITVEIAKKQRTDGIYNDDSENYEEMTQKRGRDDSKSEGEISIDNTPLRPSKRTKMPSCYDILNSLSSSTNVSSGVKRKADISRSGTPDIGKHFKSLDSIQRSRSLSTSPQQNNIRKSSTDLIANKLDSSVSPTKILHSMAPKITSPYAHSLKKIIVENERKLDGNTTSIKLTDRLFMRPEPQNIDKLKSLIQEHVNVGSKFTGDDGDEIKKSDVVIMRQTSMKARLQSMFDAISGKISGQIDPNVVIQAEQVNNSTASSSLTNQQFSSTLTTLNSSTSTTSINTSPISTSAIAPIIGKTKTNTTPGKHVTFQLPTATTTSVNNESVSSATAKSLMPLTSSTSPQKTDELRKLEEKDRKNQSLTQFGVSSSVNSTSLPIFSSSSSSNTSSIATTTAIISSASSSSTNISSPIASSTLSNISQLFTPPSTNSPAAVGFGVLQSTIRSNIQSTQPTSFSVAPVKPLNTIVTTTAFSFGTTTTVSTIVADSQTNSTTATQSTPMFAFQSTTTSVPAFTTPTSSTNSNVNSKPTLSTLFTGTTSTSSSAVTTPIFSFGQSTTNPSAIQSTGTASSQESFSFGIPATVNLSTTTTTQSQVSTKPQTVTTTTSFAFGENNTNTSAATFVTSIPNVGNSIATFGSNNLTGSIPVTTSSSMFNFNTISTAPKPKPSFGELNTNPPNRPLLFGASSQPSTPAFNNVNHNSSSITSSASNPPAFPTTSTTISQSTSTPVVGTVPFTFGTPNTQQSTFPSATPSATTVNASIPQFGVAPKSTETSAFGMNSTTNISNNLNASVAATTSASLFNSTNNSNIFGQSKIMPSTGVFATSSTASPNFTTNTTNNFGIASQSLSFGTQQPMTTAGFGITPSVISMSASTFGTTNITTPTASTAPPLPPPAFGAPNLSSTSSGFGTLKSITPNIDTASTDFTSLRHRLLFGAQSPNAATSFNTTNSGFASGATVTPTTAPPAFGAATSLTSAFGTSSGFGNANAPPPAFGNNTVTNSAFNGGFGATNSTNPISPFGSQSSTTSTFGSSNTPAPSFGTPLSSNASGSGSSAFTFGSTSTNQSQQPNSPFTFKGINTVNNNNTTNNNNNNNNNNPNNNSTNTATPFQFGAAAIPQPGGFNFTGGSQPPSFGGSSAGGSTGGNSGGGGGMFSIGSGSTAPRSRSTRPRRQQR